MKTKYFIILLLVIAVIFMYINYKFENKSFIYENDGSSNYAIKNKE